MPLTRYSFGLMTGITVWRKSNEPRVKVDDAGNYAYDPLDHQLTMVTFNIASRPYDADALAITADERRRWFIGAAIAPTIGIGYSFLPVRGLGINVGYAVLGTNTATENKKVGDVPAESTDPFKLGATGAVFFGLSYIFK